AAGADATLWVQLGPHEPLEADRVRFRRIGSIDEDDVGVLDVAPVIRHRAPPECGRQTDDRGAVSDSGLLFYEHRPEATHHLGGEVAFLAAERGAAREGDTLAAIHEVALSVLGDEGGVARFLDPLG